ncbi:MAG: hypothetical protein EZS28_041957 [Streblomastix strix]|uniref:Uncharacterized protein n=1 Tax=Streblomastix strix TaxID=222440 RepID=A0A5J4TVL3_9EUKA|nr:MAG: hypothetical protein EZS28_041957 [Streblomastix strix]
MNATCSCLNTGNPRAGKRLCPAYNVKGQVNSSCTCDTGSSLYPLAQCQQDQKVLPDLSHQTAANCPCLPTGDPRAGNGQRPAYCFGPNTPSNCVCDSNPHAYYPPQTCNSDKKCTEPSSSTVQTDSCTCSSTNYPSGCKCHADSSQLSGIPQSKCECRNTGDPRANGICPAYCVKDSLTQQCVCDTGSQSYPSATCEKDKKCKFELATQTNVTCPCLSTGDPRAGLGQCPAYFINGQLIQNCACDSDSIIYLYSTCQIDKLCQFDLINQTQEICECLLKSDPRAGDVCPPYCVKG